MLKLNKTFSPPFNLFSTLLSKQRSACLKVQSEDFFEKNLNSVKFFKLEWKLRTFDLQDIPLFSNSFQHIQRNIWAKKFCLQLFFSKVLHSDYELFYRTLSKCFQSCCQNCILRFQKKLLTLLIAKFAVFSPFLSIIQPKFWP